MNFALNARQPTPDDRDYVYENIRTASYSTNNMCDYRDQLMPVRNQGAQGTCYAQTAACVKEWQEKNTMTNDSYFSPQFIYNNRDYWNNDKQDGEDANEDYGMQGRDVMKILKHCGVCKETVYPYGTIEQACDIDPAIIESAKENNIKGYAKVNTLDGLKKSLMDNGPCLIAFPVYNYTAQLWIKGEEDAFLGGHAMTVVGYDTNNFIIRNSWGDEWGDKGYAYYKFDDWGAHWECWTTIDDLTNNFKKDENVNDVARDIVDEIMNDALQNVSDEVVDADEDADVDEVVDIDEDADVDEVADVDDEVADEVTDVDEVEVEVKSASNSRCFKLLKSLGFI